MHSFLECNGLLRVEDEARPELIAELKELTRHSTIQDIEIATELYGELINGKMPVACLLGSIFFAGEIMGVRSERARRTPPTPGEAKSIINSAPCGVRELVDFYLSLPKDEKAQLLRLLKSLLNMNSSEAERLLYGR